MQIVLSSGEILNANASKHADLHKALKGGNNNFGIVSRLDFRVFKQGKLWAGLIVYNSTNTASHLRKLQDFITLSGAGGDPYATVTVSFQFTVSGPSLTVYLPTYTKPEAYPAALKLFTDIKEPQLLNTMRITNLTDLTMEEAVPSGQR